MTLQPPWVCPSYCNAHLPPSSLRRPTPFFSPPAPLLPLQAYPFLSHSLHHLSPFTVAQLAWALGHLRWEGEGRKSLSPVQLMRAGFRVAGAWRPLFSAQRGDGAHHAGPLASLLIDDPHLATFNPSTHQSLPHCTGAHIISHYPPSLFHTYIPRFRLPARLVTGLRACAARCCQLADAEGGHDSSPRCGVVWTRVEWTGEDVPHASRPPVESAMHGNYAGSPQPPPSLPLPLPSPAPPGQWRCRWCGRWRCWATATTSCLSLSACVSPRSPSR